MNIELSKRIKPVVLATGIAAMLVPVPASAQLGGLFGGNSKEEQKQDKAPAQDTNSAAIAEETAATDKSDSATAEPAGANSFDTLCGNGQGRPDDAEAAPKRKGLFGMADRMASMTRKIPLVGDFLVDSANNLSQVVACRLYPEEQEQAAEATQIATEGGEIGKKVEWQSSVRDNVSGSSTVSSKNALPDGTPCMVLADIVIVDGEELKVSKTMCKLPGAARYTIMNS
ncbi:hypothetical protein [Sphingorhabdus sp. YGSMI21]|uniref:hypothetical protein n=1 Tax=Sphingorhabdus sp. YGSMI21 TaxID=2077182 RepID=UPI000C1E87E6|nr:hypothetical protein [Sphingorhabdus sp. YGSMI21]ATW04673.1 hypothetical protein CHN51_14875 [Sphingorhabdus sp. YGSMI21]